MSPLMVRRVLGNLWMNLWKLWIGGKLLRPLCVHGVLHGRRAHVAFL